MEVHLKTTQVTAFILDKISCIFILVSCLKMFKLLKYEGKTKQL